jgi:pimeloyl-ACP methyl ester carboxylesterase
MNKISVETSFGRIVVSQTREDGFPVVLIHGNSLSALSFEYQFNSPVLKKYRLIAPDLPGHGDTGKSQDPETVYSPFNYIKVIVEVCSKLNAGNGVIAGHSLGGHLIISALRELPDLKGALVFGTPPLTSPPRMDLAFQPGPAIGLAFKPELNEYEINLLASGFVMQGIMVPEVIVSSIRNTDPLVRFYIGRALMSGQGNDEPERIREFGKPFAILHGENDQLVNRDYIKGFLAGNLWEKKAQLIKNSGHSPQIEQAELFNSLLLRFLQGIHSE